MSKINLVIKQNNTNVEQVTSTTIDKLYNLAYENEITEAKISSTADDIVGTINAPRAYQDAVDYLREKFPNLTITVTDGNYYIRFEDDAVLQKLLDAGYGDSVGITINEAVTVNTNDLFKKNTDIVNFDEFKYFTYYQNHSYQLFERCSNLESIDLTNLIEIGYATFVNCTNLKYFNGKNNEPYTLYLPNLSRVYSFDGFARCKKLQHVTSLGSISSTQQSMFSGCEALTDVILPSSCTTILRVTFGTCTALTTLTSETGEPAWNQLTSIEDWAFSECTNLEIEDLNATNLVSLGGGAFNKCEKLKKVSSLGSVVSLSNSTFVYCTGLTTIDLTNITSLGEQVFRDCTSLSRYGGENSTVGELNMPNLTGTIGASCFRWNTSLTKITSLGNCTTLNNEVFRECTHLSTIEPTALSNITSIGNGCFYKCTSLQSISGFGNIITVPAYCFEGCSNLTTVILPDTVITINSRAFMACSNLVTLNCNFDIITYLEEYAFSKCTSLIIEDLSMPALTNITGSCHFEKTQVKKVSNLGTITSLSRGMFQDCSVLTDITIPETVTTLDSSCLYGCVSLTVLNIPASVVSIGHEAFRKDSSLTSITFNSTTPPTLSGSNWFVDTNNCPIYVPADSVDTYKAASGWSNYADRIQAIS